MKTSFRNVATAVAVLVGFLGLAAADAGVERARALEQKAHDLQQSGRYAEAEQPLLESIQIWKRLRGPRSIDALNDEINLAVSYRRRGEAARAVPILEKAAATLKSSTDTEAPGLYRQALNNLSAAYRGVGRHADARKVLEVCLAALTKGPPTEERARVLDNLATTLLDLQDPAAAQPYAERGLAEWKVLRGNEHPDVGVSMTVLGTLRMRRGQLAEARPLLQGALRITEKTRGADHPEVGAALNLLGELEARAGNLDQAHAHLERSLALLRKRFDASHPLVQSAAEGLAAIEQARAKRP